MESRVQTRNRWARLVARFERSGESQSKFTSRAGVGLAAFRYWLYKLRAERAAGAPAATDDDVRLVPVEVRAASVTAPEIEIDIRELRVRLMGDVDPDRVAALVAAVRARAC